MKRNMHLACSGCSFLQLQDFSGGFKRVPHPSAGGQQGCPLMTACHAVVHRMLWESLGLVEPPVATGVVLPQLSPPIQLDMAPCFADDGLLAGEATEVLRAVRHLKTVMPTVELQFSNLVAAASAGAYHRVNFDPFLVAGCTVNGEGNFEILKFFMALKHTAPPSAAGFRTNKSLRFAP